MLKKTTGAFDRVKTDSQNSLPLWQAVSCLNVICIAVKTDFRFVYVLVIHMFIISFKDKWSGEFYLFSMFCTTRL